MDNRPPRFDGWGFAPPDLIPKRKVFLNHRPDAMRAFGFVAAGERRKHGRKVLLWIGPGCGTGTGNLLPGGHDSTQSVYWLITLLREARLSIDEISLGRRPRASPDIGNTLLERKRRRM